MTPTSKPAAATAANLTFAEAFSPETGAALAAREKADELGVPAISTGTAALLTFLATTIKAHNAVEIGTGTGVSAIALLSGMAPDGVLTSIDAEPELQLEARTVLNSAGIPSRRARLIAGDALTVLPKLTDGAYDLVFANGDPLEYVEYVAQAVALLRPGGILVLHHALWQGKVADALNEEDEPIIIREALDAVAALEDFTSVLVPLGDGLVMAVRR